ncbi:MAG: tRNA (N(6)-L-threonylcarbamoyladenosine(37)-C(2))-methylthiotransferase MtaB [Oligoflexia bacterium]|nr:MAG: tRNA (N(6)-L-threonylcarbamoyladenosine(37)-C(2))-methylthiotransferase MtaB [Oligoflexia bacterium]
MKYQIHTFGCKVNTYDTGLIQKNLSSAPQEPQGQVHVLNTCAVTQEATKEAVRLIRRIKSKDPFATIVVTGCAAQVDTGAFENLPGADLVVANSHKGLLPQIINQHFKGELKEKVFKSNIFRKEDLEAGGGLEESHTRSFLKIQDGCNSFCTYCIIPYARGKSRSIPIRELMNRINELYDQGIREVVLTGVHIGDYQDETRKEKNALEDLIEMCLKYTQVPRFRLTSFEPPELNDRLLDLFQNPRLCPHFHMSIQSAETKVLQDMKRKYNQTDVIQSLHKISQKVPNAFVGMDVIVGFPTETEESFNETYRVLSEAPWTKLHVFPYSERQGTRAALMTETVPHQERKARAQRLRELSLHRYQSEALRQIGKVKRCLVLNKEAKGANSIAHDFWPVKIKDLPQDLKGQEISVVIENYDHSNAQLFEGFLVGSVRSELQ